MKILKCIKLKKQHLVFEGAFFKKDERPLVGRAIYDLSKNVIQVESDGNVVFESIVSNASYFYLNRFMSSVMFFTKNGEIEFHIGIFPEESHPIDNVTDSIEATFNIVNQEEVLAILNKTLGHSIIEYMVAIIDRSIKV